MKKVLFGLILVLFLVGCGNEGVHTEILEDAEKTTELIIKYANDEVDRSNLDFKDFKELILFTDKYKPSEEENEVASDMITLMYDSYLFYHKAESNDYEESFDDVIKKAEENIEIIRTLSNKNISYAEYLTKNE
ncbi:hypothetical protein AB4Y30_11205 [Ornithinibacillus sp. 4-3]|uniref:DUF4296 domain-containing protein n=1 Tax=Ornithinibacillus sp. 4-3 TaxID=3231488 RepID=A0AB39HKC3_9BACI